MTTNSSNFIVIPKSEYELLSKKAEIELTQQEAEKMLVNTDIIVKFLKKTQFAYQISLSTGKFKWSEEKIYRAMEVCDEIIDNVKWIEKAFLKHTQEIIRKEEEKEKENSEETKRTG